MTPIFEGQPPQNKAFSVQNKGHLGSRSRSMSFDAWWDDSQVIESVVSTNPFETYLMGSSSPIFGVK